MPKIKNDHTVSTLIIVFIIIGVAFRLLPHAPNFSPVAAIALFSGTLLNKRYALLLPLIIMIVTDAFLGFHNLILFTYGSFILIMLWGRFITKDHLSTLTILGSSLATSVIFFLVTNFGVWAEGFLYPPTLSGLAQSYVMAIPFFKNTLISNVLFSSVFFSTYIFVQNLTTRTSSAPTVVTPSHNKPQ